MRFSAFLLCFLLLLVRGWQRLCQPELWAEDGSVFLPEAIQFGLPSLLRPYAGYFHVMQRVITLLCLKILPLSWVPTGFGVIYIALFAWMASLLVAEELEWFLPGKWTRFICALLLCLAPGLTEMLGNLCNLNWILFLVLAFWGLRSPKYRFCWWEIALAAVLLFSIGTAILVFPLFAFRLWLSVRVKAGRETVQRNGYFLLLVIFSVLGIWWAREEQFAKIPSEPKVRLLLAFIKTSFDAYVFRPWFGDRRAIMLLRGVKSYRAWIIQILFFCGILFYFIKRRKNTATQANFILSLSLLSWPVMSWIARPGNLWAFEMPLNEWFLNHRYSFPTGLMAIVFWMAVLRPTFAFSEWKTNKLRTWIGLFFVLINLWSCLPRFFIPSYGSEKRWEKITPGLNALMQTGCPRNISGPIYPDGWNFFVATERLGDCSKL